MKKIRVAQIGTSRMSHGNAVWNGLLKQTDNFEVVGYAFPENEREKFPAETHAFDGYREMSVREILEDADIDAVAVETEEMYLTKYAQQVADAGKHLHMEKPGGICLSDFERLIDTLKEKSLVFSTGYMYRFNPMVRQALERVEKGELGRIYSVEAHMDCKHPPFARSWLQKYPGGMTFFLGCHLIDLIYRIQGEPEEVLPLNTSTGIDGIDCVDIGMAVFKYPRGISFFKTCDNEYGGFLRRQLVICGEKGTIEIKPLEAVKDGGQITLGREYFDSFGESWANPWHESQSPIYDRYEAMLINFAEMIRGKENPYSYEYERGLYRLILKAAGQEQ